MAIKSLTYLDIPLAKRRETASRALARLQERLHDPTLSEEQRQQLSEQVARMRNWTSNSTSQPRG